MRRSLICCMWVMVALLAVSSSAAQEEKEKKEFQRILPDRGLVSLGGFLVGFDTQIRVQGSVLGTIISAEDVLGLEGSQSNVRLDGYYRFNSKHRIDYGFFDLGRQSTTGILEEFEFLDTQFKVGAIVESRFDTRFYKASYGFSFFNKERVDIGFLAGISYVRVESGVTAVGAIDGGDLGTVISGPAGGTSKLAIPVPVVGQFLTLALHPRVFYRTSFEVFFVRTSKFQGSFVDVRATVDYFPVKHFGFGAGFNFVRIEYEKTKNDKTTEIDYRFAGALAYLTWRY